MQEWLFARGAGLQALYTHVHEYLSIGFVFDVSNCFVETHKILSMCSVFFEIRLKQAKYILNHNLFTLELTLRLTTTKIPVDPNLSRPLLRKPHHLCSDFDRTEAGIQNLAALKDLEQDI
jgi:hypothetical protein